LDLDSVLGAVENPIRRRIMARLTEEPNYQLQLSKELGVSQQLVAKHLVSMESAGLVGAVLEDSPRGPQRKEYALKNSFSLTIDLAPNLFRTRIFSFGSFPDVGHTDDDQLIGRMSEVLRYPDEVSRIGPLAKMVAEIDGRLKQMEDQRAVLLHLRNIALKEAAKASNKLELSDRKKVLRFLLRQQQDSIADISTLLGLQHKAVVDLIEQVEKDLAYAD
jgi:predicted transcriptional regulator